MGLLDQDQTQEKNYFPNSEADIFLQEFQQPKQEMNIPEIPEIETEVPEEQEPKSEKATRRAAKQTAKVVVGLIEAPTTIAAEFISKGTEAEEYEFNDGERDTLTDAFANYFEVKGTDLPPGVILLIAVLTIVGSKFAKAFKDRKLNEKLAEAEKRANNLEAEISKLRTQITEKDDAATRTDK